MIRRRVGRAVFLGAGAAVWIGAALLGRIAAGAVAERGEVPDLRTFTTVVGPLLRDHCFRCHGRDKHKGDLRLDRIDGDLVRGKDRARWKEIYARLNRGEMPPRSERPLRAAEIGQVADWIVDETRKAERTAGNADGRAIVRRMNRAEYANTLRDLLAVEFPFGDGPLDLLPPDGTAGGFDKIGSALTLDPSLMSQYLTVARRVADAAIVTGPRPFETRRQRFAYADTAKSVAIGYECRDPNIVCRPSALELMEGVARTWDHLRLDTSRDETIPADGRYTIRLRMGADLGRRGLPLKVQLEWPGDSVIAAWTLTARDTAPRVYELTLPIKLAGKGRDGPQVRLVNGTTFMLAVDEAGALRRAADQAAAAGDQARARKLREMAEGKAAGEIKLRPNPEARDRSILPKVVLDWIEIEGPLIAEWPPRSHRELFFEGAGASRDLPYARRIFQRLMTRAYRRPVTERDLEPALVRVEHELQAGESFEEAVKVGLEYVLCSPQFLFLLEPNPGPPRALDDLELAARLSYFLWSSLPDSALTARATAGLLHAPDVLAAVVARMLREPRAQALVDGFGAQWLQAAKFAGIPPNRRIYPEWDDECEAAVKREPLAFFAEILRHDLSALNFLDSDFAMLNERLARHYGIAGVKGNEFRRVNLPADSHRGGLVTQAGILSIGSDGTRTLPVRRAAWVLQTLFNAPPSPPPPNIGEVEANTAGANLTVRERLLRHQAVPACASCHVKLDGYGLALENFDAVGAWRTRQNGEGFAADNPGAPAIDASGALSDGRAFRTFPEFQSLLKSDGRRFGRALTEKMLGYALGRTIGPLDAEAVADVSGAFERGGYRLSALITAIAASKPFQTK
jgi:hypothetical protein